MWVSNFHLWKHGNIVRMCWVGDCLGSSSVWGLDLVLELDLNVSDLFLCNKENKKSSLPGHFLHSISSLFATLITFAGVWLISRGFIDSSPDGIWAREAFQNRSRNPQQRAGRWRVFKSLPSLCLMPCKTLPSGLLRLRLRLCAGPVTSPDSLLLRGCRELTYSEFSWHLLFLPKNSSPSSYLLLWLISWFVRSSLVKVTHVMCCYITLTCRCSVIYLESILSSFNRSLTGRHVKTQLGAHCVRDHLVQVHSHKHLFIFSDVKSFYVFPVVLREHRIVN